MMSKKRLEQLKRKYAEVIVKIGLNLEKGKIVKINADLDQPDFVKMVVEECYKAGARYVELNWTYRPILKTVYERTSTEELCKVHKYDVARLRYELKESIVSLTIESWDPKWMDGVDAEKVALSKASMAKLSRPFKEKMDLVDTPWCICCVPSVGWAKLLFPNLSDENAVNKLWELVFDCCRISTGNPIENWKNFNKEIKERARWLDSLKIKTLHYTSKNGTDLIVGVNKNAHFVGGAHTHISSDGVGYFNPNIPAVECYTTPDRNVTSGVVYSSKPLCRDGHLIENICFRFEKGRIVDAYATKNENYLKGLVNIDEGSHYLGEVALVPFDSPINKTGILFYYTIYDENASCHFAFGNSFVNTYKLSVKRLSKQQQINRGLNHSSTHIDFMIGTKDLSIVATTRDNKKIQIFKDGTWAV